jgi:hypothetical protein
MSDQVVVWDLKRTGSRVVMSETNGIWRIDLELANTGFTAINRVKAENMALNGLKRYICALIEDLDKVKKFKTL